MTTKFSVAYTDVLSEAMEIWQDTYRGHLKTEVNGITSYVVTYRISEGVDNFDIFVEQYSSADTPVGGHYNTFIIENNGHIDLAGLNNYVRYDSDNTILFETWATLATAGARSRL